MNALEVFGGGAASDDNGELAPDAGESVKEASSFLDGNLAVTTTYFRLLEATDNRSRDRGGGSRRVTRSPRRGERLSRTCP
jgi:hypothetical protein